MFDDCVAPDLEVVERVAHQIRHVTSERSRVVVTTREYRLRFDTCATWVVGPQTLNVSEQEACDFIQAYTSDALGGGEVDTLLQASGGLPALFVILTRKIALVGLSQALTGVEKDDVSAIVRQLASSQLSDTAQRVLLSMAMLGHGTTRDLAEVLGPVDPNDILSIVTVLPLVTITDPTVGVRSFRVHDFVRVALLRPAGSESGSRDDCVIASTACDVLASAGRIVDSLELGCRVLDAPRLAVLTERFGQHVLRSGATGLVKRILESLSHGVTLRHPRLLLLHAELLQETSESAEALRLALAGRDIAASDNDPGLLHDALVMTARCQMDLAMMEEASESLLAALRVDPNALDEGGRALIYSYLGVCLSCVGRYAEARRNSKRAVKLAESLGVCAEVAARATNAALVSQLVVAGRYDRLLDAMLRLLQRPGLSLVMELQSSGNLGCALVELGHLGRAETRFSEVLSVCAERGLSVLQTHYTDGLACLKAAYGQYRLAGELAQQVVVGAERSGDAIGVARALLSQAVWRRAAGDGDRALELAEATLEIATTVNCEWLEWAARLEVAAGLLYAGDIAGAQRHAERVLPVAMDAGAERGWLTADLILAEIARRDGRIDEGASRILEHEEHIRSESANWHIGMYVRAFPHLLGLISLALGPRSIPSNLLRMVLREDAERILGACAEILPSDHWRELSVRIIGEADTCEFEARKRTPVCTVRLFGGLEARVGDRTVGERDWRKRKARLLFAMLVLNRGSEMPREQVLDTLWPEMDAERARNNFYVIWSAMKGALFPGADKYTPCPYVESTGGLCRIVPSLVVTDVEQFEDALARASAAQASGDVDAALRFYDVAAELYRGPLLPGDVYEEFCASARDAYRTGFGDAMARASELLRERNEPARAILMIRRGIAADPWREDLYQAVLSLQIEIGQRSAAIETYLACKERLSEDLGLDPSKETLKLYEQVLAMEQSASGEYAASDDDRESNEIIDDAE